MKYNVEDWLTEAEGDQTLPAQAPTADPAGAPVQPQDPNVANQDQVQRQADPSQAASDVSQDPQTPDMPEKASEPQDFETWKGTYIRESRKGDTERMKDLLLQVRDRPNLSPEQQRFVEDNWNIILIRENANVDKASKQVRTLIQQQFDQNNPATSLANHLTTALESAPLLNNVFVKINGYESMKMDLYRKFIAALLGAVQVSSGSNLPDLIYESKEYSVEISTRFNSRWGDVYLGEWSLKQDDPSRYLSEPELKRLSFGSPEERDALRRRIVMESIAKLYEERSFLMSVMGEDGMFSMLGWDISTTLRTAFTSGKLVVKTKPSESSDAMIDAGGKIVPLMDISVVYAKPGNGNDEDGKPATEEVRFIERRNGMLFMVANLQSLKDISAVVQGMSFKETPYAGNPSDLRTLQRCVVMAPDLILRQC